MKPLKRCTSVLVLLISMFCFGSAFAADVILELEAGKYVVQGERVRVPVLATAVDTDRSIAGAAFSVDFNDDNLNFIGVESTFFGTFASHSITPKSVNVDGKDYTSPIVSNTVPTTPAGMATAMIAAARPTPGIIPAGSTEVLFELILEAELTATVADFQLTLHRSELNNTDAGYDANGELIAALIDATPGAAPDDPNAFPVVDELFGGPVLLAVYDVDDRDNDGLSNDDEKVAKTDKDNPDTDGDGLLDGEEVHTYFTNPKKADSDGDGFTDEQEIFAIANGDLTADPNDKNGSPGINFEVGVINDLTDTAQTIAFESPNPYFDPVVVAGPVGGNDLDATFIQIYDVTASDFKIKLTDAGNLTPNHGPEMVHWMAIDKGQFVLENGKKIFAGKFLSKSQNKANKFLKVKFPKKFFKQTPVVLASTNTVADPEPAAVRLDKVKKSDFSFTLQEDSDNQKNSSGHGPEEISVVAFDTFTDIFGEAPNEIILEVGSRGKAFDHLPGILTFDKSHSEPPIFLARMQTAYDKDSSQLRIIDAANSNPPAGPPILTEDEVHLFVQEDDAIDDGDTDHKKGKKVAKETVGYFATSPIDLNDSDGDGLKNDYEKFDHMTNPLNWDTDGDGLSDSDEIAATTDPNNWDTDGDGFGDGHEVGYFGVAPGPLDKSIYPNPFFEIQEMEIDHNWADIDFETPFYNPVIVASTAAYAKFQFDGVGEGAIAEPLPGEETDAAIVQIKRNGDEATSNWQIRHRRLSVAGEMGSPVELQPKKIYVTIIERGVYKHPDNGNVLIADINEYEQLKKGKVKKFKFPKAAKIKKSAVVFASVITYDEVEDNPVYHRLSKVSKKGFSYMWQEEEAADQVTDFDQALSYIAFGGKATPIEGDIEATVVPLVGLSTDGTVGFSVDLAKKGYVIPFPSESDLGFMMDMQSTYDKDPANVRYSEVYAFGDDPAVDPPMFIGPMISEDFSLDAEGIREKNEDMGQLRFFLLP